jgi:hypothetical protein
MSKRPSENYRETLQWQVWADWKTEGGWHYVERGEFMGHAARSTTYTHSDTVMMQLLATERHNGEAERIDIIFEDLPGLEQNFIALYYLAKIGSMVYVVDTVLSARRGDEWSGKERGTPEHYKICDNKAQIFHKSACRHLRKSLSFYRELDLSKRVAAKKELAQRLTAGKVSEIMQARCDNTAKKGHWFRTVNGLVRS